LSFLLTFYLLELLQVDFARLDELEDGEGRGGMPVLL
jgi:hypothetical protein